jgi:hypothetical protein
MKNKETFVTLVFLFCMGMFLYNYFTDDTHQMIFWGVLTLRNGQSLNNSK